jgi:AcrR family transcriptional regulator
MRIRSDGEQTRCRIIEVASKVFSERGFRDATHEVICGETGVNRAAINHHFGDKRSLYRAVWQHLLDAVSRENPVSGNLPVGRPPTERFEAHIRALLSRHSGDGAGRRLARLRIQEQVTPTGLVDDIVAAHHQASRNEMLTVLRELLGAETPDSVVDFYETCVLALCRGAWFESGAHQERSANAQAIALLAKRIANFVLMGIENEIHSLTSSSQSINRR